MVLRLIAARKGHDRLFPALLLLELTHSNYKSVRLMQKWYSWGTQLEHSLLDYRRNEGTSKEIIVDPVEKKLSQYKQIG